MTREMKFKQPDESINQPGSVLIEFACPMQKRGNYRFHVQAKNNTGNELFKGREFGVKSKNYPSLKTPIELAEPLIYSIL